MDYINISEPLYQDDIIRFLILVKTRNPGSDGNCQGFKKGEVSQKTLLKKKAQKAPNT
jgi:hypothetical protein